MRNFPLKSLAGIALVLMAGGAGQGAQQIRPGGRPSPGVEEIRALQQFEQRVHDYVALHRQVERQFPPLQPTHDMSLVYAAVDALAGEIRAARHDAVQGDVFTPDVARVFRKRIALALTPEEVDALLNDRDDEADEPVVVGALEVNGSWPEGVTFDFVPPQLIAALPPLQPELQYRIIGRSLVLWDHHANLIVDFLPAAFTT